MSASTSRRGRCQFSVENANRLRYGMPRRRAVSTTARTEPLPRRWPSIRDIPRRCAQRPLPSMMTATWRGQPARAGPEGSTAGTTAHLHDLVFFGLQHLVQALGVLLGELLGLLLPAAQLVLREIAVALQLFEQLVRVAPMVAQRDAVLLRHLAHMLDQFAPPLLGELG